jgi:hypothetical protein
MRQQQKRAFLIARLSKSVDVIAGLNWPAPAAATTTS